MAQVSTVVRVLSEDNGLDRCASCNSPMDPPVSFCTVCGAPRRTTDSGIMAGAPDALQARLERATEGEYRILTPLGHGGMGAVFLALDQSLHRHVAIKVMAPALVQNANMQERFRTEARIVATLRHPGIVNIHGFRVVDDLYFFVMDYVEGATLRSIIRANGPLPVEVVQAVLYDVGSALHYAHSRSGGVIHRDVKPSNVILEPRGHSIVMDFGISKAANARSGLTITGTVVGTPEYMSPEQCRGGAITAASDQYSLGLVAYAMLTGAPPFTGQHWSVLAKHTTADPTPIGQLRPDCPPEVAASIERMLSKAVKDRWPDILTAVKALGGTPLEDTGPTRVEIGRLVEGVSAGRRASTPVSTVEIDGLPDKAETGDVVSITVTPFDGVGRPLDDREYVVESTDPSVLEVVGVDTLKAVREGTTMVLARCEDVEVTQPLRVTPSPVDSVAIMPPAGPVHCGDRVSIQAMVLNRAGQTLEGRPVVWASSDPAVARISSTGELQALSAGSATIFATSEGKSTTLDVDVLPVVEETVEKEPLPAADDEESAASDAVVPAPGGGPAHTPRQAPRPKPRAPTSDRDPDKRRTGSPFLWFGSAVAVAAAVVFWVTPLGQPSAPDSPDPSTGPPEAASVEITRGGERTTGTLELRAGETVDLDAVSLDASGATLRAEVEWSSSDAAVASVDVNGLVAALASGVATISARSGGLRETIEARVTGPPPPPDPVAEEAPARPAVDAVAIRVADSGDPVGSSLRLEAGSSLPLRAVALSADGGAVGGAQIAWSSSNPAIVDVDRAGVLRATAPGSVTIAATVEGVRQSFAVTVVAPPPGTLVLTVRPWAYVSIDGVRQGEDRRRVELSLPAGPHEVRLENPAMTTVDTTIVIRSNEVTRVDRLLTPGGGR